VTVEAEWFAKRRNGNVSGVLEQALRKKQIRESLMKLGPERGSYGGLKQALARHRDLASKVQWPLVSGGPPLKKGSLSERVVELRKRLLTSGDLEADGTKRGDFFDMQLEQSVILFQRRHGLKPDGIVGSATLNALNVPGAAYTADGTEHGKTALDI
jgi:murein L,D-transpeptidase YcbB/YkuD